LIGDQYLASITAAKITAGTIGAHQIILSQAGPQSNFAAPANMAVLRSSDYDGTYNANTTTWTTGTDGWIIAGDGYAEFSSASIRGGLKAESVYIDANNRWRRNANDTEFSNEFRVGSSGNNFMSFSNNTLVVSGAIYATTGTFSRSIASSIWYFYSEHCKQHLVLLLGTLQAASGDFSGEINASEISASSFTGGLITSTDQQTTIINLDDGHFNFGDGKLYWSGFSLYVEGDIHATSGKIGEWVVEPIGIGGRLRSADVSNPMILDPSGTGFIQAGGIAIGNGDIRAEDVWATNFLRAKYIRVDERGIYFPTAANIGSDNDFGFSFAWSGSQLIVYLFDGSSYTPVFFNPAGTGGSTSVTPTPDPTVGSTSVTPDVNPAVDPETVGTVGTVGTVETGGGGTTCDCSVYDAYCNSLYFESIPTCDEDCNLVFCIV
jgi:hypothetical protein